MTFLHNLPLATAKYFLFRILAVLRRKCELTFAANYAQTRSKSALGTVLEGNNSFMEAGGTLKI